MDHLAAQCLNAAPHLLRGRPGDKNRTGGRTRPGPLLAAGAAERTGGESAPPTRRRHMRQNPAPAGPGFAVERASPRFTSFGGSLDLNPLLLGLMALRRRPFLGSTARPSAGSTMAETAPAGAPVPERAFGEELDDHDGRRAGTRFRGSGRLPGTLQTPSTTVPPSTESGAGPKCASVDRDIAIQPPRRKALRGRGAVPGEGKAIAVRRVEELLVSGWSARSVSGCWSPFRQA